MLEGLKTLITIVAALLLFVIGVAGLFLPVIPGLLFIALSLIVLSTRFNFAKNWVKRIEKKHPEMADRLRKWRRRW